MTGEQSIGEQGLLVYRSYLGTISLAIIKASGTVYFLADRFYKGTHIGGMFGISVSENNSWTPVPNDDLEAFIEDKTTEKECLGLVPVTNGASEALSKAGLKEKFRGAILSPEDYQAVVFSLPQ